MRQNLSNFKENRFFKLYLILFFLINLVYIYLKVSKTTYAIRHSLGGTIEKYQFEYLSNISRTTNSIELVMVIIYLIYFIKIIIKKDKMTEKEFLILNSIFFVGLLAINYLVSVVLSTPHLDLIILPIILLVTTTFLFLIYALYNKRFKKALS